MLLPLLLLACPDPTKDKAPAVVTEAVAPPAPVMAPLTGAALAPTPGWITATGTVGFQAAKVTRSHDANFGLNTILVQLEAGQLSAVKVEVTIASLKTDAAKLDAHLQSPDFFDAAAMPVATFVSTAIRAGAPADSALLGATHTVEGDLTIHGITKHVVVPAVIVAAGPGITASTEFTILRQDFGVTYPGKPDDLIADRVLIRVNLTAASSG